MDPVRTAIMNNRFTAIVEEASTVLHRTAHTTFVKLVQDYQCALATPEGDIFAYPSQSGVTVFIGLPLQETLNRIGRENFAPGDCYITNDPFFTDGLVTHMMDVTLIYPIFRDGELIAFGWSFVHASDIGGAVPGSISPTFTESFQEGLRVRPIKLFDRGRLNPDAKNIFLDNSRIPDEMWGDFQAMLSAMKSMDKRLNQLCDRYGAAAVKEGMNEVIAFAELKARQVIAGIPDGTYSFSDYLEGIEENQHAHITATMTVKGEEIDLDFTGTDPQVAAAYNFIIGERTHPYVTQALTYYIMSVEPGVPKNAGLLRPIRTKAPRGTVINAEYPAAMGSRVASGTRVFDVILGCLNQALPDGVMAAGAGMVGIIVANARDPHTGRQRVSVLNPIIGGGGGRIGKDGIDGVDGRSGALKSIPTEVLEVETVMHMRRCHLVADTQSPGRWRGGAALVMEIENTGLEATMTVRGMNRFKFRPWGFRGGFPGKLGEVVTNPGRIDEKSIGKIRVLHMARGDVVQIISPAGGGFGNPLERAPDLVLGDVRMDLLSLDVARDSYGVVIENGEVDQDATLTLRKRLAAERDVKTFSYGPEREAYNGIWTPEIRSFLAETILAMPRPVRQKTIEYVREQLTVAAKPVTRDDLMQAIASASDFLEGRSYKVAAE
ncbi:hydantoinase B/oxoprolinase family protein [Rhizobium puerariae]|uniref:Hydantoinase B/oxoprolinase family protein n=1 Tax=Rhizobium puerariae TaxID=1585791 RepID=A0ABV6ACZ9_9HYPH